MSFRRGHSLSRAERGSLERAQMTPLPLRQEPRRKEVSCLFWSGERNAKAILQTRVFRPPGNFPSRRHCAPVGRKHMTSYSARTYFCVKIHIYNSKLSAHRQAISHGKARFFREFSFLRRGRVYFLQNTRMWRGFFLDSAALFLLSYKIGRQMGRPARRPSAQHFRSSLKRRNFHHDQGNHGLPVPVRSRGRRDH